MSESDTSPGGSQQIQKALASKEAATSKAQNLGTVDSKSLMIGGAGQGGGLGLNKPGFGPAVKHFAGPAGSVGKPTVAVAEEVKQAWAQVMDDKDPLSWIFCEYSTDGKSVALKASGNAGLREFKDSMGEALGWGGFRCNAVDRRGTVECKRPKFIFVQFKPESAPMIKKAKMGSHKGDMKEVIHSAHLDITVDNKESDLSEQELITKLQAATGAHKPNGYEFETGEFLAADYYGLGIGRDCKGETVK